MKAQTLFTSNLRRSLMTKNHLTPQEEKLLWLTGQTNRRSRRVLSRLERHASVEAEGKPWNEVDWERWLKIIGILVSILFLFLDEEPD